MRKTLFKSILSFTTIIICLYSCNSNNNQKTNANQRDTSRVTANSHSDTVPQIVDTTKPNETPFATDTTQNNTTRSADVIDRTAAGVQLDSTKKYVFLTFDDGPQPGTMNVYHNLQSLGIKGTFFMVGLHATFGKQAHDEVDTIRNSYPQILLANHSYTHANDRYEYFYHHVQDCFDDFMRAQQSLNVQKKFIRLPGNSAWVLATGLSAHPLVKPVCELLDSAGYNVIGWDVEWSFKRDPSGHGSVPVQSAETMVRMVENALNNHHTHRKNAAVLLSHDRMFNHQNYSDSLYKFMRMLQTRHPDYVFETVDNYPGAKK